MKKISKNEIFQKGIIYKIKFNKKELLFNYLIILLLILIIFLAKCQDSIITLKVSETGLQKIFNSGTKPDEVLIDNISQNITNSYQLEPTNIVKLIWTNEIIDCKYMFYGCDTILEMNLDNFDATNCTSTQGMFRNCTSLKSLDLSGFKTSKSLKAMNNMFWNCFSLISLNLSTFDTSNVSNFGYLFCNCQSLEWIDVSNINTENLNFLDNMFNGCKNLTSVNLSNFNTSKVKKMDKMFSGCESLKIIDFYNLDVTSVTNINITDNIFTNCTNLEYINIQNLNSNINLDNKFLSGTPINLIVCNANDNIELSKIKLTNNSDCRINRCYNNNFNTNNLETNNDFGIVNLLNDSCMVNYIDKSEENSFDDILNKIENLFTSKGYDTSEIENGKNEIIKYQHMTITLTSTKNQKNENTENATTIDLGDCERLLKEAYNIPDNETLFIKKIDVKEEGMKIPKVVFEVYYKLNGINLEKLNLTTYSKNCRIDISVPAYINKKDIDKYNASSGYYNDICYVAESDCGTDIILNDRQNEFIDNNKTVCQDNCFFSDFDDNINKAKCSCDVVESSNNFENIKINKAKLLENFIDIKNIANIHLLICYEVLFSKKGLIKNYGSYSIIIILLIHFIIIIIYYAKNLYKQIQNKINDILFSINNIEILNRGKKDESLENSEGKNLEQNIDILKNKKPKKKIHKKMRSKRSIKKSMNHKHHFGETIGDEKKDYQFKNKSYSKTNNGVLKQNIRIIEFNDTELNDLNYDLARKFDKRTYCQYYFSLLKTKHPLFFTFFNRSTSTNNIFFSYFFFI